MQEVEVVVISISSPLLVGVYFNKELKDTYVKDGKTSDILAEIFDDILKKYQVLSIYYVNGPGSYMSIKVSYIFLKTLSIVQNSKLFAVSGFEFNENSPIKAIGKKYFIQKDDKISLTELNDLAIHSFELPSSLQNIKISLDNLPNYVLPAV
ncbi:hypothetical protein [Arcobacter sp. FWKO B]|uniref:hypothetical protein n=1 Tax=Arcobacter sp. FWKO B TaxID=2593672 RepID=UPI0018A5046E|nr:hypothetical protein [Arcobacter sp. FWKO B]QOG12628.1 hypothetical protein FWKOB_07905 [Arcobacter sp. FWKO B]